MSSLNRSKELTEVSFGNRDFLILKSVYRHYSWTKKKANMFLLQFDIFVKSVENLFCLTEELGFRKPFST